MTVKQGAFLAVPVLFFLAFGIEELGMWWERRKKSTQNARGTTQPQLPPR